MEAVFTVVFCPEDDQDFTGGLVVITEREAFEVPVLGTGAALSTQAKPTLLAPGTGPYHFRAQQATGVSLQLATKRTAFGTFCSEMCNPAPRESDAALQEALNMMRAESLIVLLAFSSCPISPASHVLS